MQPLTDSLAWVFDAHSSRQLNKEELWAARERKLETDQKAAEARAKASELLVESKYDKKIDQNVQLDEYCRRLD